ncbi:preprotein translocase subunit SecG [Leptolyngbya sp. FACHB-261]|uniref:preprotein translocase subunit SecG n=1 Tax=Leptolyngbya sp. FACHB-261 TaxID=2692806 RepID=UPI0016852725|nr:preprotein translocase subunit SecG [Leptolyngbya sp. FACHB-261]MBD2099368.1 preprotein translocase subunit SecG [Leptolyngbya sp. FACHB-261]
MTIPLLYNILTFLWSLIALCLVILILLHSPKGDGLGGIGGQAQLFTSTRSAETTLNRITWTMTTLFLGITVVLSAGWVKPAIGFLLESFSKAS